MNYNGFETKHEAVNVFANAREISNEISEALLTLFPENAHQVWEAPSAEQMESVLKFARELQPEGLISWGEYLYH